MERIPLVNVLRTDLDRTERAAGDDPPRRHDVLVVSEVEAHEGDDVRVVRRRDQPVELLQRGRRRFLEKQMPATGEHGRGDAGVVGRWHADGDGVEVESQQRVEIVACAHAERRGHRRRAGFVQVADRHDLDLLDLAECREMELAVTCPHPTTPSRTASLPFTWSHAPR